MTLKELNTPESRESILARLIVQANGQKFDVSLSSALEFRREAYGLSTTDFAFVLGLQRSHYNEIINGRRALPTAAIKRAYAIGVPAGALLQP